MHLPDWKVKTDSFVEDPGKGRQDTNFCHPGAFLKASQGPLPLLPVNLSMTWGTHLCPGLISHTWVPAATATLEHLRREE